MSNDNNILRRIIETGSKITNYLDLQREVLHITQADVCLCFLTDTTSLKLRVSHREGISKEVVEKYIGNLLGKKLFLQGACGQNIFRLREFWKEYNQSQPKHALIAGASNDLSQNLQKREFFLVVTPKFNLNSDRLEPLPCKDEKIVDSEIDLSIVASISTPVRGWLSIEDVISRDFPPKMLTDLVNLCSYNLLPPYPVSFVSIPLGFSYTSTSKEKDFISVAIGWFGKDSYYGIEIEEESINEALLLCKFVSHEIIAFEIDPLYYYWHFSELKKCLSPTKKSTIKDKHLVALELILKDKTTREITLFFLEEWINHTLNKRKKPLTTVSGLLNELYDALRTHEDIYEKIPENIRDATDIRKALMLTRFYRGTKEG